MDSFSVSMKPLKIGREHKRSLENLQPLIRNL